jgi:hypothetical protein
MLISHSEYRNRPGYQCFLDLCQSDIRQLVLVSCYPSTPIHGLMDLATPSRSVPWPASVLQSFWGGFLSTFGVVAFALLHTSGGC